MPRRVLEGNVVSAKNNKTITVLVERKFMHPVYKKYIKSTDKYTAHDEVNSCKEGDRVSIIECRPISKTKRWSVVSDGQQADAVEKGAPVKEEKKVAKKAKASTASKKKTTKKKDA